MIVLLPAYGRQYESLDTAEQDWIDGKDFKILKGPYCSIRDTEAFKAMGHAVIITAGQDLKLSKIVIQGT